MILRLRDITVKKEKNTILKRVSLDIPSGEFFVLMGPTGSGKTTTLRIAGLLDTPDTGDVLFQGETVPRSGKRLLKTRRRIATVFQSPVMFQGTVLENLEWGLKIRGLSKEETVSRISRIADLADLNELLSRDASTLSGGETRRTALARALVLNPELLILDEPTTSLHPSFRKEFLESLLMLHRETGTTFLMATHDFTDALAAGTMGAVMRQGEIEQQGSIDQILFSPRSRFMADFTGTGNILSAVFCGNMAETGGITVKHTGSRQGRGFIAVPPEVIVLSRVPGVTSERNRFQGTVSSLERKGLNWTVTVDVQEVVFAVAVTTGALDELEIQEGSPVWISFKASAVHVF